METQSRSETDHLIRRLVESPEDFDFFRAVSLLEAHHRLVAGDAAVSPVGCAVRPEDEFLRFGQRPSLQFQSRAIEAVTRFSGDQPMRMYVNFTGFFGPNGALPLWVTEHALKCQCLARRQLAGGARLGEGDIVDASLFARQVEQSASPLFQWLRKRIADSEKGRGEAITAPPALLSRIEALGAHAFRVDPNRGILIDALDRLLAEPDFAEAGLGCGALKTLTVTETAELVGETEAEQTWFLNRAHLRSALNSESRGEQILGPDPRTGCDSSFVDFLNLLQHRFLSLFFRAWSVHQLPATADDAIAAAGDAKGKMHTKHPGIRMLASLGGVGTSSAWSSSPGDDDSPFFRYLGLLPARPRSAEALRTLLHDCLQVPVQIRQFVGRWVKLAPTECCQLGEDSPASRLGESLVLGDELFVGDLAFRVELGPLRLRKYKSLLPGTKGYIHLKKWVDFFSNRELGWELNLILHKDAIPACELVENPTDKNPGVQLGWTSWLSGEETNQGDKGNEADKADKEEQDAAIADPAHRRDFLHDPELEDASV